MGMFSEILHELDGTTTHYMVDDMKEKIKKQGQTIAKQQEALAEKDGTIAEQQEALASKNGTITEQQKTISEQKAALEAMEAEFKRLLENQTTLNKG